MSVIQAGIIGVIGTVLAVQLKSGKNEYAVYAGMAVSLVLFSFIIERLGSLVRMVEQLSGYIKIDAGYFSTMMKMIGITYISQFSADICKDAGYQTIAGQIEIFGKLTILALGMPVLLALLETIQEFLI